MTNIYLKNVFPLYRNSVNKVYVCLITLRKYPQLTKQSSFKWKRGKLLQHFSLNFDHNLDIVGII